jgi:hypothetical protein
MRILSMKNKFINFQRGIRAGYLILFFSQTATRTHKLVHRIRKLKSQNLTTLAKYQEQQTASKKIAIKLPVKTPSSQQELYW